VSIADPDATARRAIELLSDEGRWRAAQRAGIARVERYYTEKLMLDRYRAVYEGALGGRPHTALSPRGRQWPE
jgi:glycosyltransferase involved in cell wall biosynthesis